MQACLDHLRGLLHNQIYLPGRQSRSYNHQLIQLDQCIIMLCYFLNVISLSLYSFLTKYSPKCKHFDIYKCHMKNSYILKNQMQLSTQKYVLQYLMKVNFLYASGIVYCIVYSLMLDMRLLYKYSYTKNERRKYTTDSLYMMIKMRLGCCFFVSFGGIMVVKLLIYDICNLLKIEPKLVL